MQGISLPLDQYKALLQAIPDINAALTAMGETVDSGAAPRKARVKGANADAKEQKANIDETSDEDDAE